MISTNCLQFTTDSLTDIPCFLGLCWPGRNTSCYCYVRCTVSSLFVALAVFVGRTLHTCMNGQHLPLPLGVSVGHRLPGAACWRL